MNTTVTVACAPHRVADVQAWFARVESTLTRFDPDSPLCRLNALSGRWVMVPALLYQAVAAALRAAAATKGAFDPTILPSLEAAGYGRSFELGPASAAAHPAPPPQPSPGCWPEVRLDPRLQAIWLPPGVRLDLGGIGKGLAVDGAMSLLAAGPALVNAGGDLALQTAPDLPPVLVDTDDPFQPDRTLATFTLRHGAVATSSILVRCWGEGRHHIIDPRTGQPTATDVVAATVLAGSVVRAEVLAKACVVAGRDRGLALLAAQRCQGLLVAPDGSWTPTSGLEAYLHG